MKGVTDAVKVMLDFGGMIMFFVKQGLERFVNGSFPKAVGLEYHLSQEH